ncbi:MAG: TetR/AcrR family transcriptional regulator [bacterium]|nr:TetR/AcrR family transcriptional regulator [bacterium]
MVTGLRDRKKKEQRHRIILAATGLFAEKGLDHTTMDDIAAASNVSVATVYNYFGSKSALLLAGVGEDTELILEAGRAVLESPGSDVVAATRRLAKIYVDELSSWDKRLLREVLSAAYQRSGGTALTEELAQMDQRLIEQMMMLLSHFHEQGDLAPNVDVYEATLLVFSAFVLQLFMYMSLEELKINDLSEQVDRQITLVFTGIQKAKSQ